MKEIIINTQEIESVWEKEDACLVKMNSGKVWVCKKYKMIITNYETLVTKFISTMDYLNGKQGLVRLTLLEQGVDKNGK